MKIKNHILILTSLFILVSCAKQSTPMGGEKDEIPPKLVSVNPTNESIDVKPSIIELTFDEYVKAETPNKQIIITPRINKDEMQVTASRNRIIIKLNQELEDSTTYVFNFQKSIKDITENNPAENLKLVFSTGPYIDSLTYSGKVNYIFPPKDKNYKDVLVGLYPLGDTTDVLTGTPYYLSTADSTGRFVISNIKAGSYNAYAWHDANNSLKAEDKSEAYAFLGDTINITEDKEGATFYLAKADLAKFRINRASPIGSNFDIVLNKTPVKLEVYHESLNKELFFRKNEKTLRFYHSTIANDSIPVRLDLRDSVGYKIDTTLYVKFEKSDRPKEKLEPTFKSPKPFLNTFTAELNFNKPISEISFDSLFVKYDTASVIAIKKEHITFENEDQRTKLLFNIPISQDIKNENFTIWAAPSTFQDVEGLVNEKSLETSGKRLKRETLAEEVKITVNTKELPLIIQVLNKKDELVEERYLTESNTTTFRTLEGGVYQIRAILDHNKNKMWDTSNMHENRQAEPVYYLFNPNENNSRDITIRGGWSIELTIETDQNHNN
jgi:hypothetical protein